MELGYTEDLKSSVRKDLQVRILPPLPTPPDRAAYSYLSLHQRQKPVIERVARAITALRPGRPVGFRLRGTVTIVNAYSNAWPILFPQHGRGRKHERPVVLDPWQRDIVEENPVEFLRGCIESDGCKHCRVVAGRNYPESSFTHHSQDILELFVWACRLVGCGRVVPIG